MRAAESPAVKFWRDRGSLEWARVLPGYWGATAQPHRAALIQSLRKLPRFESARELGCCAGTNILMLRQVMPWVTVEGLELSPDASIFAQQKFVNDPSVRITCTNIIEDSKLWAPAEADVVFTCYTLTYISPDDIADLMEAIVRSAGVGIVLTEPMYGSPGRIPVHYTTEWRHDYVRLLDAALHKSGRPAQMTAEKLTEPVEHCDGILRVEFA